jgi:hypothetical protein
LKTRQLDCVILQGQGSPDYILNLITTFTVPLFNPDVFIMETHRATETYSGGVAMQQIVRNQSFGFDLLAEAFDKFLETMEDSTLSFFIMKDSHFVRNQRNNLAKMFHDANLIGELRVMAPTVSSEEFEVISTLKFCDHE